MSLPFKVCPECGVEYIHTALVCADCNVALEVAPIRPAELPGAAPFPPASELTRVAAGDPWEMERLALELQQAGITSRIDMPPAPPTSRHAAGAATRGAPGFGTRLALYVRPADGDSARRVIQGVLAQDGPGAAARAGDTLEACPACGARISEVAAACSDCGLEFIAVEDLCSSCGAVLTAEATACQSCGASREGAG